MTKDVQTIAVGFDGSQPAEAAVRWAFTLARPLEAEVVLVHAVGLLGHLEGEDVTAEFHDAVARLAHECNFDIGHVSWQVEDGNSTSVLMRASGAPVHADLIVVGSRGKSAHAGLMLGSTSLQLAERSTIPVMIVPFDR